MSTAALPRNPSRAPAKRNAVAALVILAWRRLRRRMQAGRDRRALQALPDYMLSDLGLEKMELRTSLQDSREVWLIRHRDN